MCNDPIDPRTLEEAGQLGLFAHEPEPVEEDLEELVNDRCREELEEELYRERVLAWHPELEEEDLEDEEEEDLEDEEEEDLEQQVKDCSELYELYRARVLAWHPELEEEDLEEDDEWESMDDSELEDIDELRERVELEERTGDYQTACVLSALETGLPIDKPYLTRSSPRARAKVLSRILDTIGEVRVVLEAEGLIPPDSEPETVHDLIHGKGRV